jgi:hypothetical protein
MNIFKREQTEKQLEISHRLNHYINTPYSNAATPEKIRQSFKKMEVSLFKWQLRIANADNFS